MRLCSSFAKSFALSLDIPMIEVNHMQAHVLAHFAEDPKPDFPFLCLKTASCLCNYSNSYFFSSAKAAFPALLWIMSYLLLE